MNALLIDAYDSFVFIIRQYLLEAGIGTTVVRNDAVTPDGVAEMSPDFIVLGPGPGHPADAGYVELITRFRGRIPMLGICLGHQAFGLAFGGRVARGKAPVHGKTSRMIHDGKGVFTGIAQGFTATRYHSLVVEEEGLPDGLEVTAVSEDDRHIMGLRDRSAAIESVQFHPESVYTQDGLRIFTNFVTVHVAPSWRPAAGAGKGAA
ncbi:MAG TPA: aminodeoxychorismate/anthranilate synthase component II [Azospirillaceae bacterium]|nr:aminodeoxychorismate/anthranilate synthase component II [Azospirillaceae bacterium]